MSSDERAPTQPLSLSERIHSVYKNPGYADGTVGIDRGTESHRAQIEAEKAAYMAEGQRRGWRHW